MATKKNKGFPHCGSLRGEILHEVNLVELYQQLHENEKSYSPLLLYSDFNKPKISNLKHHFYLSYNQKDSQ